MKEKGVNVTISGSFKYKTEIDNIHREFSRLGALVLGPSLGWDYHPHILISRFNNPSFRPLPSEIDLTPRQIEDSFLSAIAQSQMLYIVTGSEGYVGSSVCLEAGFALARGLNLYAGHPLDFPLDPDPLWKKCLSEVKILSPEEALTDYKSLHQSPLLRP